MISRKHDTLIEKRRLFVGSGIDSIVDPSVSTVLDNFGQYHPEYSSNFSNLESTSLNSDISLSEDDISRKIFSDNKGIQHDNILGYYLGLYAGHTIVGDYRKKGSSGGMVSWFATKLLESGNIDGLIHVKKARNKKVLFEYGISRTASAIQNGAKSRYYPAELSHVLKEVKRKPGKYAVVAIPEIITELRLLAELDQTIKDRIIYYIGLVCGHQKTTRYAEAIAWEYGITPGNLIDIDFRVKKNTGSALEYDMKFTGLVDGRKKTYVVRNNEPFVSSWAHGFFKARFSDFTDNTFNENADIVFGDAWLDEYMSDPMGTNIVIVRNSNIKKILDEASKNKEIKVDKVSADTIIRSQQGLIHHTRDELPYRLYKEKEANGWAPKKRVQPSDNLDSHRKKVQDIRQQIAEKSHKYYEQALKKNDFSYFKAKMQPLVNQYKKLYNEPIDPPHVKKKAYGAIVSLTGYFNYGSIIQRYALQKFLKKNGYDFVSYVNDYSGPRDWYRIGKKRLAKTPLRAVKRFIRQQKPYWYIPKYSELYPEAHGWDNTISFVNKHMNIKPFDARDNYKCYIVGSDQVWRDWWNDREILGHFFLNFLKGKRAKRIAYAASFGNDKIENSINVKDIDYIKPYIDDFDAISVREKSGIPMIKRAWGRTDVRVTLDPTMLLTAQDYSKIIDTSSYKDEPVNRVFAYILDENDKLLDFIDKVLKSRQQEVTKIRAHSGAEGDILPGVEMWLKGFRDADFVVTNSFHGMVFSIINNTDFVVIGRDTGGLSRIKDFLSDFNIENRFVDESKIDSFDIVKLKPINWQKVNKILENKRLDSSEWLLDNIRK